MNKSIAWALGLVSIIAGGALVAMTVAPPNLSKALEAQQRLVLERPFDAEVHNDLGNLLLLAQRPAEAEEAYLRAIELDTDAPQPRFNLALMLQQAGRLGAALDQLEAVLDLDPDNAWAHYQIGAIFETRGDKRRAIRFYGQAFALDPQLASAEVNPQIIENRLVVESMLRGYGRDAARPLAPKVYDERGRIVDLMVAQESEPESAAPETAQESSRPERMTPTPAWSGEVENGDAMPGSEPAAGVDDAPEIDRGRNGVRVLTPDTIERGGSIGQATPSGAARSTRGRRPPTRGGTTVDPRTNRAPRGSVGVPRPRYQPPSTSTGSLDLDLVPVQPAG